MNQMFPILYQKSIPNLDQIIAKCLRKGHEQRTSQNHTLLFFRADDIGVPSAQYHRLIQLFLHHKMPLCLATVPTWLTTSRLEALTLDANINSSQWCWHQHGWLHKNHETSGKKQEFGPLRSYDAIKADLERGKIRLQKLLGSAFFPFFTPPWNRCGETTLIALKELHFQGLSRSKGAHPAPPPDLLDISINVDLHTRKEANHEEGLTNLLKELSTSLAGDVSGIMIHHQIMNDEAFRFLDILLQKISETPFIQPVHFKEILVPYS